MKIVFFGTSSFAANVLSFLIDHHFPIVAVVTKPDSVSGRSLQILPPPVKKKVQDLSLSIPVHQPIKASADEFAAILKTYDADVFLVIAYGEILKKNILELPKKCCINVHASLLPKYRGAAPIHRAIMDGETKTGISIIEMSRELDAGDVLAMKEVEVAISDNFADVEAKLLHCSCELLIDLLGQIEHNKISKVPQDHTLATYASKLTPLDEEIDWKQAAAAVHNKIRAFSPRPGASCLVKIGDEVRKVKIKKSTIVKNLIGTPGQIISLDKKKMIVACGEDALSVLEVQLEGKKSLPIEEFLRGLSKPISFVI